MIEATCSACGALNRVSEANVPVGAKFITCADCKSRIAIAAPQAPGQAGSRTPPPIPRAPGIATSAGPTRSASAAGPARSASAASPDDAFDLADLPAPKRASPLGPLGSERARPAARPVLPAMPSPTRAGLNALDPDLPAPRPTRTAAPPPIPVPGPATIEMADPQAGLSPAMLDDGIDLPAPKRPAPYPAGELGRSEAREREALNEVIDLPAPKPDRIADLPAPKRGARRDPADPAMPSSARPSAVVPPGIGGAATITDLPAPKRGAQAPVPADPALAPGARPSDPADLPAPKGFFDDLPQVKSNPSGGAAEALAPRGYFEDAPGLPEPGGAGHIDLPAPKGFFDDLPQPALRSRPDLPAPKGYFENLPQVKSNPSGGAADVPAPKGYFEDIPGLPNTSKPELPAPQGYFENIPGLPNTSKPELPAPQGYFEDIPGLPNTSKPELPAPQGYFENIPGLPNTSKPELPAPQGFFDDIPGLPRTSKPEVPAPKGHFENVPGRPIKRTDDLAPKGFFDDLPQPARSQPAADGLELEGGPELDLTAPSSAGSGSFDDLDLSKPSPAPIRFESAPSSAAPRPAGIAPAPRFDAGPALELEGAHPDSEDAQRAGKRLARPAPAVVQARPAEPRPGRRRVMAAVAVAVIALGAGGYALYQRHVAAEARGHAISDELAAARAAYAASDLLHWQRASAAARRVLQLDDQHPEALGIASESLLASALGDGTAAAAKLGQAHALLDTANAAGISSPQLARARALSLLAAHQPDAALVQLQPMARALPRDGTLALYLGWALADRGDAAGAIKAFDSAAAAPPAAIAALYGRGNARLELLDLDGARGDFQAVLQLARDHIGAQVGLAAAQPPSAAQQQEADLGAILARKDIAAADPRAVARAWTLAGVAAARAGRSAVARERFKKALAVVPQDLAATTGLADTELQDGKVSAAAELIASALGIAKDNVPAQLVECEIEIRQGKLPLAAERIAALAGHATPLAPLDQARLSLVSGRLLEAQGKDDDAVLAYSQGAKLAGDLDLAPLMAAVGKLAQLTSAALAAKDDARAAELRQRSDQLLADHAAPAERDPRLAMTLGMAYLQQGDAAKAERWLGRVVEARPSDAEARYQLGRALLRAGKSEAALEALNAALSHDPMRSDIGVELARTYEALGRDGDAAALYGKLLAGREPSLELRARSGRFYARIGELAKAGEQGSKIVEIDPHHAAGLYLKGEGLLAAGKALDAKQAFQQAISVDRDPQYFDALGRAAEAMAQGGDRELQDLALRSYQAAVEAQPTSFNALAGQGRLYVARHEAAKALPPLLAAARLEPRSAEVMFLVGAAHQELQQTAMALQWLEASTKIAPSAEAYWRLGQIYRDANQGAKAADALGNATRLAEQSERKTGAPVPWLTDALYLQGRVNFDLHSEARAREAWVNYVGRNPPASARLTEVQQLLATSLRR
jgi:tetratricopeptide (TPR) repeat protein